MQLNSIFMALVAIATFQLGNATATVKYRYATLEWAYTDTGIIIRQEHCLWKPCLFLTCVLGKVNFASVVSAVLLAAGS